MSNRLITEARAVRGVSAFAKLALILLADHADEDGVCYPGIDLLMADGCMPERTLTRALAELQSRGLITRRRRFNASSRYIVRPSVPASQADTVHASQAESYPPSGASFTPPRRIVHASQADSLPPPRPSNPQLTLIEPTTPPEREQPRPQTAIDRVTAEIVRQGGDPKRGRGWAVAMLKRCGDSEEVAMEALTVLASRSRGLLTLAHPNVTLPKMAEETARRRQGAPPIPGAARPSPEISAPREPIPRDAGDSYVPGMMQMVREALDHDTTTYPTEAMTWAMVRLLREGVPGAFIVGEDGKPETGKLDWVRRAGPGQFPTVASVETMLRRSWAKAVRQRQTEDA